MGKINILTSTGSTEALPLVSAFKSDNNNYVILDSEKTGSMGLPIINVCKLTTKLEKISDPTEWQNVKNCLKGIISGTNFEYVKVDENMNADEAYYTPLTLPQASFDLIRSRYNVGESVNNELNPAVEVAPVEAQATPTVTPEVPVVTPDIPVIGPVEPVMPEAPASNIDVAMTPIVDAPTAPVVDVAPNIAPEVVENPVAPAVEAPVFDSVPSATPIETPTMPEVTVAPSMSSPSIKEPFMNFDADKETFLKACENMFDALVSKYQKEIALKEEELSRKEQEINLKMQNASEHLANAEAREQVANIALDNASQVMNAIPQVPVADIPAGV